MHLIFCMYKASQIGLKGHPQKVMRDLGITYQYSVSQSISDSWEFWNCENIPEEMPEALRVANWNPMERIGWGLSQEMAEKIRDYKQIKEEP